MVSVYEGGTYLNPMPNMPHTVSFFLSDICNFQMMGMGAKTTLESNPRVIATDASCSLATSRHWDCLLIGSQASDILEQAVLKRMMKTIVKRTLRTTKTHITFRNVVLVLNNSRDKKRIVNLHSVVAIVQVHANPIVAC